MFHITLFRLTRSKCKKVQKKKWICIFIKQINMDCVS